MVSDNDPIRRYLDAGVEFTQLTRQRAEEIVRDLTHAGEVNRDQAAAWVEELLERSRQSTEALLNVVRRELDDRIAQLNLVTRDDLANLAARLTGAAKARATGAAPATKAAAKKTAKQAAKAAKKAGKAAAKAVKAPAKKAENATKAAKATGKAAKATKATKAENATKAAKATGKAAKKAATAPVAAPPAADPVSVTATALPPPPDPTPSFDAGGEA